MKDDEQIRVEGDQPATLSWLLPVIDSAVGERPDRWTYEVIDIGGTERTDVRIELRSPTRDAALIVTANADKVSGKFTDEDPLTVAVRRAQVPPPAGPLRRTPGQIDELQKRLVELIVDQSEGPPAPVLTPEEAAREAFRAAKRRKRLRNLIIVVSLLAIVINGLMIFGYKLILDGVATAVPAAYQSSKVIKGTKPKGATACPSAFRSSLTPKRSAIGNRKTKCDLAEAVRSVYLTDANRGGTVKIAAVPGTKYRSLSPVTCRGKATVTCTNKDKISIYLY